MLFVTLCLAVFVIIILMRDTFTGSGVSPRWCAVAYGVTGGGKRAAGTAGVSRGERGVFMSNGDVSKSGEGNGAEEYADCGLTYLKTGNIDKAIECFNEAIRLNPNHAIAYKNRGNAYIRMDNFEKAIENYTKAIQCDPGFAVAYHNRGNAYSHVGNLDNAIADYTRLIELNPNEGDSYVLRGSTYYDKGDRWKAIDDFTKAIGLNPSYALAYFNRGNVYGTTAYSDKAIEDYVKAIGCGMGDNAVVHYKLGCEYSGVGKHDKAIECFDRAILLNPNDMAAYFSRGNAYLETGYVGEAIKNYNVVIKRDPNYTKNNPVDSGKVYYKRGVAYDKMGKAVEAADNFNKAIELYSEMIKHKPDEPDNAFIYHLRAEAYYATSKINKAIEDCENEIRLDRNNMFAYYFCGVMYAERGNDDDCETAKDNFNAALRISPDFKDAKEALEKLNAGMFTKR
jgi:tetratricopeptide (TPR) repeat protein